MPSMTESMGRLANAIAQGRRERGEATKLRRAATSDRAASVASHLGAVGAARTAAARAYRTKAASDAASRTHDLRVRLDLHRRQRHAQHRHRLEAAAKWRSEAAAFMAQLTESVTALREEFRSSLSQQHQAHLAAARTIQQRLAGYARDRQGADDAWSGRRPKRPVAAGVAAPPAAERPVRVETPRVETPKVETPKAETPRAEPPRVETPRAAESGAVGRPAAKDARSRPKGGATGGSEPSSDRETSS